MMIRKTGLFLLIVVPAVVLVWLYLARNAIVTRVGTLALEKMVGTRVELQGVQLDPFHMRATFQRLRIQSRANPKRYALVAGPATFQVNGSQLFAGKFIVDRLSVDGLGFDVPCPACPPPPPAPPPPPPPPAGAATTGGAAGQPPTDASGSWSLHVPMPKLNLDALKQKLDVTRVTKRENLASVQAVDQAEAQSKARIAALQQRYDQLDAQGRLKAIQQQVKGLDFQSRDPRKLKAALEGLKDAQNKLRSLDNETRALMRDVQAEPARTRDALKQVRGKLNEDVDATSRLLHLGGLNVGQVGQLVFGHVVLQRFNWVLAQFQRVRGMLASDEHPARKPPRRAGREIAFPVTGRAYPGFLVQTIAFAGNRASPSGGAPLGFTGRLTGLSSDAQVYGEPMRLEATASGGHGERWTLHGSFDHRQSPGVDTLRAVGHGVLMGDVRLSGGSLPEKATSRDADVTLDATLRGLAMDASLNVDAHDVQFHFASGTADTSLQRTIRQLFAGFDTVNLRATLGGTLTHPRVGISSSIDEQFSRRMRDLLGQREAEARARIRAQIQQIVDAQEARLHQALEAQRAPLEAKAQQARQQLQAAQAQLHAYQAQLDQQKATLQRQKAELERKKAELIRKQREEAARKKREAEEAAKQKLRDELKQRLRLH